MNMETFSSAFIREGPSCESCSLRFNLLRRKRVCTFCKSFFCGHCITRRPDKKLSCKNCQILTARPLDKSQLLKLRNRDLLNYLTSRHIPVNGCVEKEDLVNTLVRAVNNSSFHANTTPLSPESSDSVSRGSTYSYPNSPYRDNFEADSPNPKRKQTQSVDDLSSSDGIRVEPIFSDESTSSQDGIRVLPIFTDTVENCELGVDVASVISESHDDDDIVSAEAEDDEVIVIEDDASAQVKCEVVNKPLLLSDISSKEDLQALSVKQLKELLMRNRTDFKGCVERTELLQKVNQLWTDYTAARKDIENLSIEELCKICMDAPIECVLLECGHMCTCTSCGKQLSECPICRQYVVRCIRTFKA